MNGVVVVGSLNADLVVTAVRAPAAGETVAGKSFSVFEGGKGANQAVAAARAGGAVKMLGRVGKDAYGESLLANLNAAGVDTEATRCLEGISTGVALITVEEEGENRIVVVPGANGHYTPAEFALDQEAFDEAKVALFQLETPLDTVAAGLRRARERGCLAVLDPAPARPLPDELLASVDLLTPNARELALLAEGNIADDCGDEEIACLSRRLIARGVGKVIAKLGARGALLVDSEESYRIDGYEVEAVDTTAAGDCFNGVWATAFASGANEREAARFACAAAAISVTREGAQPALPTREETLRFLAERPAS